MTVETKLQPVPISAAERIAKDHGYDQVIIYARKVGGPLELNGEHVTTYGKDLPHCAAADQIGKTLKRLLGWGNEEQVSG